MDVMVHSSMRSLGYVVNGALDVIDALRDGVGPEGTILMPSHTGQLTDPAGWTNPPLAVEDVETVRQWMRPLDRKTPIRNRGVIPQAFLGYEDVVRSEHPLNSVIAQGPRAREFTSSHPLHQSEGIESPIGSLYAAGGHVLLIGVSLTGCTAIHLAEFIADVPYLAENQLRVLVSGEDGSRQFVRLSRYPNNSDAFDKIRDDYLPNSTYREAKFREGTLTFFELRPLVDFVVGRLRNNPSYLQLPAA